MAPEQGLDEERKNFEQANDKTSNFSPSKIPVRLPAAATTTTDTSLTAKSNPPATLDIPKGATSKQRRSRSTSPLRRRIHTSWVSYLTKHELEDYHRIVGLSGQGTVEELRRRFAQFLNFGDYDDRMLALLKEWEQEHRATTSQRGISKSSTEVTTRKEAPDEQPAPTHVQYEMTKDPVPSDEIRRPTTNFSRREQTYAEEMETYHDEQYGSVHRGANSPVVTVPSLYEPYPEGMISRRPAVQIDDRTYDCMRTWGLTYDGQGNPVAFMEQLEEMAAQQRVPLDQIPFAISCHLRGAASTWWWNRRHEWTDWRSFRVAFFEFFLPIDYNERLSEAILRRTQRPGESFKPYVAALETLMRHAGMTMRQQVERIHRNCLPEIRRLIKPSEFQTLGELTRLVSYLEGIPGSNRQQHATPLIEEIDFHPTDSRSSRQPPPRPAPRQLQEVTGPDTHSQPSAPTSNQSPIVDHVTACRRCGQQGHFSRQCRNAQVLFCRTCGKREVSTRNCCGQDSAASRETTARVVRTTETPELCLSAVDKAEHSLVMEFRSETRTWGGLVDTGAWHSYISAATADELPQGLGNRLNPFTTIVLACVQMLKNYISLLKSNV